MRILRARLLAAAQEEADAAASEARRSQVRTVDRSERIRTYNFPENRISDHRTGYKAYNLDQVLDGDLQPVIDSCVEADLAARLAALESSEPRPRVLLAEAAAPAARRPASPAPSTTPPSCSPTSSAPTAAGCRWSTTVAAGGRATYDALVGPARRPRAAAAPDRARRTSATSSSPSARASSCPGPRPSCSPAGPSSGPRALDAPVVVDLCTGSGAIAKAVADEVPARPRARRRAGRAGARAGPSATSPAPASTCGSATSATAFDDLAGTVDVVVCNPPYIPLDAWESVAPEARDHDPAPRAVVAAPTASTRSACSRRRAAAAARGPGEWSGSSTPTSRASPRPRCFAATGRWADVRDHRDLAGRPRFTTARLAR